MSASAYGKPAAPPIIIDPKGKHSTTIVWLHGLGDTGEGWSDVATMMSAPHIKWIFPTAPVRPVSINGGFPCTAWFDIKGLSADAPEDINGLDAAAVHIGSILQAESKPDVKLAVGGFSMGGALALYVATRKLAGKLSNGTETAVIPKLSAALCLSGWLPNARGLDLSKSEDAGQFPVILCHGTADMVVPASFGQLSATVLQASGLNKLIFKSYPGMGHEARPQELGDVQAWIKQNL